MAGTQVDEIDWENMTNKELHDKFHQMLGQQVEDVMASCGKVLLRRMKLCLHVLWVDSIERFRPF